MIEKIVLTGAPGCGKSSIIKELEIIWNQDVINEAAEDIISNLQAKGNQDPWILPGFQEMILRLQYQREAKYDKQKTRVFIDRGLLDGLAYHQVIGKSPSELMKKAIADSKNRYTRVFLIELGDTCKKTSIRKESFTDALVLQELQFNNYSEAGYNVIRIPYRFLEDRAKMVLEFSGGQNARN